MSFSRPGDDKHSKELCLLSLDGGGVRGLSSLLILKKLMEALNPDDPPKPCDYFDMIGGTSTGGLIAIMLGRLQMSVDECIAEYKKLSPSIFTKIHHRVKLRDGTIRGRFDHEALEKGIQDLLRRLKMDPEALLKEDNKKYQCKVFVCATSRQTSETVVFSNYYSERRGNDMRNIAKIWQVARATSAASSFFEPIDVGGEGFVDGGTGANNPIQELWSEAADCFSEGSEWVLEKNLRCLVSVGTGKLHLTAFGTSLLKNEIGDALVAITTNTDKVADMFQKHHSNLYKERLAFRFNVSQGLESVGLEEASKISDIEAATRRYIQTEEAYVSLKECAANLNERKWILELTNMILNQPYHNWSSAYAIDDDTSLSYFPHTSSYVTWVDSGGSLCYRKQPTHINNPLDDNKAACILAYVMSHCPPINDLNPHALYFRCSIPKSQGKQSDNLQSSVPPTEDNSDVLTDPEELVQNLIVQALALASSRSTKYLKRVKKLYREKGVATKTIVQVLRFGSLFELLELFRTVIGAANAHFIISIDNAEGIKNGQAVTLISKLHPYSEDHTIRRDVDLEIVSTVRFIFSGTNFKFISQTKNYRELQEDTEYGECMQCMPFERQDARRNEIAKVESRMTEWIWTHKAYNSWRKQTSGILWVQGKPGSGKSVLAKNILEQQNSNGSPDSFSWDYAYGEGMARILVCDWFYSTRGGKVSMAHKSFLQSILYQLLLKSPPLFRHFKEYYRQVPPLSKDWLIFDALMAIMKSIANAGVRVICVVDAMDESEDRKAAEQQRRNILTLFGTLISEQTSRMKLLVLSRPTPDIEREFWHHRCAGNLSTVILEDENGETIRAIVKSGVESLRRAMHPYKENDEGFSSPYSTKQGNETPRRRKMKRPNILREELAKFEDEECDNIQSFLLENAQGVILWVTLVIASLKMYIEAGVYTFPQLRERLTSLPTDLDDLYRRIAQDLLTKLDDVGQAKSRRALMLISGANALYPFRLIELREALAVPGDVDAALQAQEDPISKNIVGGSYDLSVFRRQLRIMCGPLVDVIKAKQSTNQQQDEYYSSDDTDNVQRSDLVQLAHRTVKDFLANPEAAHTLAFSEEDAVREVEETLQSYVTIVLPTIPTAYAGNWKGLDGVWTDTVPSVARYLEHRTLMPFILSVGLEGPLGSDPRTKVLHFVFDNCISPVWKPSGYLRQEIKLYILDQAPQDRFIKRAESDLLQDLAERLPNLWVGRMALAIEYMGYACSHGLVTTMEILLRLLPLFVTDHQTDRFFFQKMTQTVLLAAVQNNLPNLAFKLSVMSHYDSWVRSLSPWKALKCTLDEYTIEINRLELAAARIGNVEMTMKLFEERISGAGGRSSQISTKTELLKAAQKLNARLTAQGYADPCVEGSEDAIRLATDYIKQAFPGFRALKRLADNIKLTPNSPNWRATFKQAFQIDESILRFTSDPPSDIVGPPPRTREDLVRLFQQSKLTLFWLLVTKKELSLSTLSVVILWLWFLVVKTESIILFLPLMTLCYFGALELMRFNEDGRSSNDFLPGLVGTMYSPKRVIDEWLEDED